MEIKKDTKKTFGIPFALIWAKLSESHNPLWACRVRFLPLGLAGGFQLVTRPPFLFQKRIFFWKNR
jgi:hypothetical protein